MAFSIPDATLEEIKARTDLGDLISSYGITLHHAGSSLKACCPFHSEKTPSFHVNSSRGFYHCFGCGEKGDAIKFVQKMEGLTFIEAVKKLASRCGVEIKESFDPAAGRRKRLYALMLELAQFYRRCLLQLKNAASARDYLLKRALDDKTQEDFLIGFAPAGSEVMLKWAQKHGFTPEEMEAAGVLKYSPPPWAREAPDLSHRPKTLRARDYYHRFDGRLMFSIRDRQGRVVAFSGRQIVENKRSGKYVNSPETEIFRKSSTLYGFDRAAANIAKAPHREVIICEGQIDCIRLHISGFPVAVASQGTAFTAEHVKMLSRVADSALLVFDDDAAGHKATIRAAGLLLAAGMPVRTVSLPDGDDPDSFLRTKGPEAFKRLMENAESVISFQCRVERAKEANADSLDAVSRVTKAILSTIVQCQSAVLRASMIGEAAKILGLPSSALLEELEKTKAPVVHPPPPPPPPQPRQAASAAAHAAQNFPPQDADLPPEDLFDTENPPDDYSEEERDLPPRTIPPPRREADFAAFLLANEYDGEIAAILRDFLGDGLFIHDFTSRFTAVWLKEVETNDDAFGAFADALNPEERAYFDAALAGAEKSQPCALAKIEQLREFLRYFWVDALVRKRGTMNAFATDKESISKRLAISSAIKRLRQCPWNQAEKIIQLQIRNERIEK